MQGTKQRASRASVLFRTSNFTYHTNYSIKQLRIHKLALYFTLSIISYDCHYSFFSVIKIRTNQTKCQLLRTHYCSISNKKWGADFVVSKEPLSAIFISYTQSHQRYKKPHIGLIVVVVYYYWLKVKVIFDWFSSLLSCLKFGTIAYKMNFYNLSLRM